MAHETQKYFEDYEFHLEIFMDNNWDQKQESRKFFLL